MGKKLFIVILVLFALLYFGGLSFGVYNNATENKQEEKKLDLSKADNGFMKGVDWLLGVFSPSLVLSGVKCNEQPVYEDFVLTESQPSCSLMLENADAKGEEAKNNRRGKIVFNKSLRYLEHVFVCFEERDNIKPPENCNSDDQVKNITALSLKVIYTTNPLENAANEPQCKGCWIPHEIERRPVRPVGLSVQEGGGVLHLECIGCRESSGKKLSLLIE